MRLALVQQHATPDRTANLERAEAALREAARQGAHLVAFAELAFERFFPQRPRGTETVRAESVPGPTTERFSRLARELHLVVVLNLYEREGGRTFDSSPVLDADGRLLGVARMVHIMEGPCFHEQDYYVPGDRGVGLFDTAVGRLGVAICYDRHYPEYMRALALGGAQLVVIPQAGAVDEWPSGLFEAEVRVAAFQNGYFAALVNRVGREECLTFAGESFVSGPQGHVLARAPRGEDAILYCNVDFGEIEKCAARRHFLPDRRPEVLELLVKE